MCTKAKLLCPRYYLFHLFCNLKDTDQLLPTNYTVRGSKHELNTLEVFECISINSHVSNFGIVLLQKVCTSHGNSKMMANKIFHEI